MSSQKLSIFRLLPGFPCANLLPERVIDMVKTVLKSPSQKPGHAGEATGKLIGMEFVKATPRCREECLLFDAVLASYKLKDWDDGKIDKLLTFMARELGANLLDLVAGMRAHGSGPEDPYAQALEDAIYGVAREAPKAPKAPKDIARPALPLEPEEAAPVGTQEQEMCVVCFDRKKATINEPCMHVAFCVTCARNEQLTKCSLCQVGLTSVKRAYL